MPFQCPECLTTNSLEIVYSLAIPADNRSDEIFLQITGCGRCGMRGLAVYEESRRGSLGQEAFNHTGYRSPEELIDTLSTDLRDCPDPNNPYCTCETHQRYAKTDANGIWNGVEELDKLEMYVMVMGDEKIS